jgi:hypothetical protein
MGSPEGAALRKTQTGGLEGVVLQIPKREAWRAQPAVTPKREIWRVQPSGKPKREVWRAQPSGKPLTQKHYLSEYLH